MLECCWHFCKLLFQIQSDLLQKLKTGYKSYLNENTKKSQTNSDVIFKKILSVYCKVLFVTQFSKVLVF